MALFCFDLSRVFLQGATMPPTPQKNFNCIHLQCGKEIARRFFASTQLGYFFRVPPCPPYILIFFYLSLVWEGDIARALCFCFDLSMVFLQDATMPPLHPGKFFSFTGAVICVEKRVMVRRDPSFVSTYLGYFFRVPPCSPYILDFLFFILLQCVKQIQPEGNMLRLSQGISSGFHHATPTPQNFFNFWMCQQCWKSVFCFDLSRVFLQDDTMPPLHKKWHGGILNIYPR